MYLLSIDIDGEEYVTVKYIQKSDREGYVEIRARTRTTQTRTWRSTA